MTGNDWLTGGAFGVEVSVVALGVCTLAGLGLLAVALSRRRIIAPRWQRAGVLAARDEARRDPAPSTFVPRRP
jgi:hypothetical protein